MKTNELDYELPPELIAQDPATVRSAARLLVLGRDTGTLLDSRFGRIGAFLRPGDCLVLNDTKVLPARFFARRRTGGGLEGLFLGERASSTAADIVANSAATKQSFNAATQASREVHLWEVLLKGARKVKEGEYLAIEDRQQRDFCTARLLQKQAEGVCLLEVEAPGPTEAVLNEVGFPPLPPYIRRDHDLARAAHDLARYQTVYARTPGAVAAPTAGLHFTEELMNQLRAAGVGFAYVTLHVGAGTFKPIAVEQVEEHEIHREWYHLDTANAAAIQAARQAGGRIVAVGTTVTRVLETVANVVAAAEHVPEDSPQKATPTPPGVAARKDLSQEPRPLLRACEGTTNLFITPGYQFRIVEAMITNFHLPRSTLLALVGAFTGLERMRAAYRHAIEQHYRFYSYGDAMLIA